MNTTFVDTRMIKAIGALDPVTKGMRNLAMAQLYCWARARGKMGHPVIEISFYRQQADIGSRQTIYDQLAMLKAKGLVQKSDADGWEVCPDSDAILSEIWNAVSKNQTGTVQGLDNTKNSSKKVTKNVLREAANQILDKWNYQAKANSHLKKRNRLLEEDLTAIESRVTSFPDVDLAAALSSYLKENREWMIRFCNQGSKPKPWMLRQVLSFKSFGDYLDSFVPDACATSDSFVTLKPEQIWDRHHPQVVSANIPMGLTARGDELMRQEKWSEETYKQKHAEAWQTLYGVPFSE